MLREVRTAWTFCAAVVTIAAKDEGGWQVVLGPLQRVEEVTVAARVDRKVDRTTTTATREVYFILLKLTWYSLESWSFAVVLAAAPVAALFIPEHWALSQRRGGAPLHAGKVSTFRRNCIQVAIAGCSAMLQ